MSAKSILLGEISSYKAIAIAYFIKKHYPSILVYSYDTKKFTYNIHTKYSDRHFIVSLDKFEDDLSKIIREHHIDYFFPVINDSLSKLWQTKEAFYGTLDYLGDIASYHVLNDKILIHKLALQLGLKAPVRYESTSEAKLPYVIKPTNLSSAKGVVYVRNEEDIPHDLDTNIIVQQYVEGVGVGYSFYCKNGVIMNGYGHRRLAEYPVSGGSSTYRETYQNDDMVNIAVKIVAHLNYTGFAMFEYKLTSEGDIYLIEVNPRIWGSINQGLANGNNYFEGILGKPEVPAMSPVKEKKTYLVPLFYLSLLKYSLKGQFKPLLTWIKNFSQNSADVSLFSDSKGWLSMVLRKMS